MKRKEEEKESGRESEWGKETGGGREGQKRKECWRERTGKWKEDRLRV